MLGVVRSYTELDLWKITRLLAAVGVFEIFRTLSSAAAGESLHVSAAMTHQQFISDKNMLPSHENYTIVFNRQYDVVHATISVDIY